MAVPSTCAVCKVPIAQARAVFLHCECCIAYCINCVLTKISSTKNVYNDFTIECPNCKGTPVCNFQRISPQIDEASKKFADLATEDAIESAFIWLGAEGGSKRQDKSKVRYSKSPQSRSDRILSRVWIISLFLHLNRELNLL